MLQLINGAIVEQDYRNTMVQTGGAGGSIYNSTTSGAGGLTTGTIHFDNNWIGYPIYWNWYPVYVCHDKTKKAIEVLQALQDEKLLKCESVPRFIELVEKISNLL